MQSSVDFSPDALDIPALNSASQFAPEYPSLPPRRGRVMIRSITAIIAFGLLSARVAAQEPATAIGQSIAQSVCAQCHQVEANPTTPSRNPDAPRFADIARMPATTALAIRVFLRSTHSTMPNFLLSVEEIESLSAYILGLANK